MAVEQVMARAEANIKASAKRHLDALCKRLSQHEENPGPAITSVARQRTEAAKQLLDTGDRLGALRAYAAISTSPNANWSVGPSRQGNEDLRKNAVEARHEWPADQAPLGHKVDSPASARMFRAEPGATPPPTHRRGN